MSSTSKDIPVLNGIRGLAVIIVFASHASNICYHGEITGFGAGQLGVMLFFVLSGFLMSHLYMSGPATAPAQRRFMLNRIARIYPMFAFVVLACFAINRIHAPVWVYQIISPHDVLINLSLIQGYDILWTIGPECIFYLLFMLLWKAWHCNRAAFFSLAIVLTVLAWLPVDITSANSLVRLHDKLPYFLVGCLIGLRSDAFTAMDQRQRKWMLIAFWLCLTLCIASFPQLLRLLADVPKRLTGAPWPDPWSFPFYLIAIATLFITGLAARPWVLTNGLARFLGKISFSFYLLHFAVLRNIHAWMPQHPLRSISLAFVITAMLSSIFYAALEAPMRRLVRRIGARTP